MSESSVIRDKHPLMAAAPAPRAADVAGGTAIELWRTTTSSGEFLEEARRSLPTWRIDRHDYDGRRATSAADDRAREAQEASALHWRVVSMLRQRFPWLKDPRQNCPKCPQDNEPGECHVLQHIVESARCIWWVDCQDSYVMYFNIDAVSSQLPEADVRAANEEELRQLRQEEARVEQAERELREIYSRSSQLQQELQRRQPEVASYEWEVQRGGQTAVLRERHPVSSLLEARDTLAAHCSNAVRRRDEMKQLVVQQRNKPRDERQKLAIRIHVWNAWLRREEEEREKRARYQRAAQRRVRALQRQQERDQVRKSLLLCDLAHSHPDTGVILCACVLHRSWWPCWRPSPGRTRLPLFARSSRICGARWRRTRPTFNSSWCACARARGGLQYSA